MATLGPHHRNYQESLSTLQFAKRCKLVVLNPVLNSQVNINDELENPAIARERVNQLEQCLMEKEEELVELFELKKATENELIDENNRLT